MQTERLRKPRLRLDPSPDHDPIPAPNLNPESDPYCDANLKTSQSPSLSSRSYKKLPEHVKVGSQILCADGSFVLEVLETNPKAGTVRAKAMNNASLG